MSQTDDWTAAEQELLERLLAVQRARTPMAPALATIEARIPQRVRDFRRALTAETDRGCALFAVQHLDDELDALLRATFIDDAEVLKEMMEGKAPLSTFSARIDLAYLCGLLRKEVRRELHLLRKIRNAFAHTADHTRFAHVPIRDFCHALDFFAGTHEDPRLRFCSSVIAVLALIHAAISSAARPTPSVSVVSGEDIRAELDILLPGSARPEGENKKPSG